MLSLLGGIPKTKIHAFAISGSPTLKQRGIMALDLFDSIAVKGKTTSGIQGDHFKAKLMVCIPTYLRYIPIFVGYTFLYHVLYHVISCYIPTVSSS